MFSLSCSESPTFKDLADLQMIPSPRVLIDERAAPAISKYFDTTRRYSDLSISTSGCLTVSSVSPSHVSPSYK